MIKRGRTDDWKQKTNKDYPYIPESKAAIPYQTPYVPTSTYHQWVKVFSFGLQDLIQSVKVGFDIYDLFNNATPSGWFADISRPEVNLFSLCYLKSGNSSITGKELKQKLKKDGLPSSFPFSRITIRDKDIIQIPHIIGVEMYVFGFPLIAGTKVPSEYGESGYVSIGGLIVEIAIVLIATYLIVKMPATASTIIGTIFGFFLRNFRKGTSTSTATESDVDLEPVFERLDYIEELIKQQDFANAKSDVDLTSIISRLNNIIAVLGVKLKIL